LATENGFWSPILQQPKNFNHQSYNDWNFFVTTFSVCHCGLAIYMKRYVKATEELWKFQYFTMQKYNLQKKMF
jgi:hypothetical protein